MSDLQCPARVYVATPGEAQQRPSDVRIASVYTWPAGEVPDVRAALDEIADRHRGESVLVLVDEANVRRSYVGSGCRRTGWRGGAPGA